MTNDELTEQGFQKHDLSNEIPSCYKPDDMVDNIIIFTHKGAPKPIVRVHEADYLFERFDDYEIYHRPHIPDRELLIMARDALKKATIGLPDMLENNGLIDEEGMILMLYEKLTLINQRLPHLQENQADD